MEKTESAREKAKYKYVVERKKIELIYDELKAEDPSFKNAQSTLYKWKDKEGWDYLRNSIIAESNVSLVKKGADAFAENYLEQLQDYIRIRRKSAISLDLDHEDQPIDYDRKIDAVKAIDMSIQGERKIRAGVIGKTLLDGILLILTDEITDEQTLFRIATKFQKLIAEETL